MSNIRRGRPPGVVELVIAGSPVFRASQSPVASLRSPLVFVLGFGDDREGRLFGLQGGEPPPAFTGISNIRRGRPLYVGDIVNTRVHLDTQLRGNRNHRNGNRTPARSTTAGGNEKGPAWASPADSGFCLQIAGAPGATQAKSGAAENQGNGDAPGLTGVVPAGSAGTHVKIRYAEQPDSTEREAVDERVGLISTVDGSDCENAKTVLDSRRVILHFCPESY